MKSAKSILKNSTTSQKTSTKLSSTKSSVGQPSTTKKKPTNSPMTNSLTKSITKKKVEKSPALSKSITTSVSKHFDNGANKQEKVKSTIDNILADENSMIGKSLRSSRANSMLSKSLDKSAMGREADIVDEEVMAQFNESLQHSPTYKNREKAQTSLPFERIVKQNSPSIKQIQNQETISKNNELKIKIDEMKRQNEILQKKIYGESLQDNMVNKHTTSQPDFGAGQLNYYQEEQPVMKSNSSNIQNTKLTTHSIDILNGADEIIYDDEKKPNTNPSKLTSQQIKDKIQQVQMLNNQLVQQLDHQEQEEMQKIGYSSVNNQQQYSHTPDNQNDQVTQQQFLEQQVEIQKRKVNQVQQIDNSEKQSLVQGNLNYFCNQLNQLSQSNNSKLQHQDCQNSNLQQSYAQELQQSYQQCDQLQKQVQNGVQLQKSINKVIKVGQQYNDNLEQIKLLSDSMQNSLRNSNQIQNEQNQQQHQVQFVQQPQYLQQQQQNHIRQSQIQQQQQVLPTNLQQTQQNPQPLYQQTPQQNAQTIYQQQIKQQAEIPIQTYNNVQTSQQLSQSIPIVPVQTFQPSLLQSQQFVIPQNNQLQNYSTQYLPKYQTNQSINNLSFSQKSIIMKDHNCQSVQNCKLCQFRNMLIPNQLNINDYSQFQSINQQKQFEIVNQLQHKQAFQVYSQITDLVFGDQQPEIKIFQNTKLGQKIIELINNYDIYNLKIMYVEMLMSPRVNNANSVLQAYLQMVGFQ